MNDFSGLKQKLIDEGKLEEFAEACIRFCYATPDGEPVAHLSLTAIDLDPQGSIEAAELITAIVFLTKEQVILIGLKVLAHD